MKKTLLSFGAALLSLHVAAAPAAASTNITGLVTSINEKNGSFAVLIPVSYDPKTAKSAELVQVTPRKNAAMYLQEKYNGKQKLESGILARIYLAKADAEKLETLSEFKPARIEIEPDLKLDEKGSVMALPVDIQATGGGKAAYKGKKISFSPTRIFIHTPCSMKDFVPCASMVSVSGYRDGDKMDGTYILLTQFPDPRKTDDPKLPRVLVIGDSISMNYHDSAKEALKGKFNYHRINGNSGDTRNGVKNLDIWLGPMKEPWQKWDVVVLNHGLHDLKQAGDRNSKVFPEKHQVEPEEYAKNLENILTRLTSCSFKVIVCTTTPVPNDRFGPTGRRKNEDLKYNEVLLEVVKKFPDVQVLDLNKLVRNSKEFDEWRKGNDVHYGPRERAILGEAVAEAILKAYGR